VGVSASVLVNMHVCTCVCWFICLGCMSFVCKKRGGNNEIYQTPFHMQPALYYMCIYIHTCMYACMHICVYHLHLHILYIYVYGRC